MWVYNNKKEESFMAQGDMTPTAFLISQVQEDMSFQKRPNQQLRLTRQPEPPGF